MPLLLCLLWGPKQKMIDLTSGFRRMWHGGRRVVSEVDLAAQDLGDLITDICHGK